ncbi:cytochrome c [Ectothiorhodospiraceae bacterium 2226]|nr:cytochrome c [Ectothiorhodospiraceae bacterium 2226]
MREEWARWVTFLSGLVILVLALAFAWAHNRAPMETPARPRAAAVPADGGALIARGRDLYQAQGCAACHAVQGVGNPRNPLDGVGRRLSSDELHDWIVAADHLEERLPPSVVRRKQRYQELGEDELAALVAYLQSL